MAAETLVDHRLGPDVTLRYRQQRAWFVDLMQQSRGADSTISVRARHMRESEHALANDAM